MSMNKLVQIDYHRLNRILDRIEAIGVEIAKLHAELDSSIGKFQEKLADTKSS